MSLVIKGLDETLKALADLAEKEGTKLNKVVKVALQNAMEPLAHVVQSKAPVKTGALRNSIKVDKARKKKEFIICNVVIGSGHAAAVEMGTKGNEANDFASQAFDSHVDGIVKAVEDEIAKGIDGLGK